MKTKILLILSILFILSISIFAIQVKHTESEITETVTFSDPYLFMGKALDFKGKSEDLYFLGKKINFTGETKQSFIAFGEEIFVNGIIGHNIISAGKEVDINGKIKGTLFLAGGNVTIQKDAVIDGAVFVGTTNLKILGKINGDLYLGAGKSNILNGEVNGNVKAAVGKFEILENGKINGNLDYKTDNELTKNELAKVTGTIKFEKIDKKHNVWFKDKFDNKKSNDYFFYYP